MRSERIGADEFERVVRLLDDVNTDDVEASIDETFRNAAGTTEQIQGNGVRYKRTLSQTNKKYTFGG